MGVYGTRDFVIERDMWSAMVIECDRLFDGHTGVGLTAELVTESVFIFEGAVESFGLGVLVAVVDFGHADAQPTPPEGVNIGVTTILDATV